MSTAPVYSLPVRLSRNAEGKLVPGRGDAGWTMYQFKTPEDRDAFVKAHRASAILPGYGPGLGRPATTPVSM